ncbi:hypothetical protein P8625_11960 [Tenacibaculum tangerinum]|uniref:Uncharacterized protein n=1 Tax=Tenacibaculum tangerinum TaxID=3038772 RepID=A0ABY8L2A4_9FLAO|nr:hypothetical protein [Tenacibaculum tangerinum]WGH74792.1 hypothetical protein P8625_11960 [Tenacibaculum tangerinum]
MRDNKKIWCSDVLTTEYNNQQLSVVSFVDVDKKMKSGIYYVNTFVNGNHTGKKFITLK